MPANILFITTSHNKIGDSDRNTGVWLEELVTPYYSFIDAGLSVTFASPLGGIIPIDPRSRSLLAATRDVRRFLKDEAATELLSHSAALETVHADRFAAVFFPGGHGALWDLPDNKTVAELVEAFNRSAKPIGCVGHGVAGLLSSQLPSGLLLCYGRNMTGMSNGEELTDVAGRLPFLIETRLRAAGALYTKETDFLSYVVADGNIVTGQNSASAEGVAKKIKTLLQPQPQLA